MNAFKSAGLPRHLPLAVAIVAALTWLPADFARAEDAPANPAEDATAKDATELNAVIVTANKREEDILNVPSSISVINDQQLENLHATQLSDLQAYVPGLYINSNGSPGKTNVSLRGVSALSSSATVGTYLDETPLGSSGIYQAANFFTLDLLPYDIARVEVLRGPQGTLYGASAMGGLLKYVTVEPDLQTREFRIGGGISNVENSGDLGWNGRFAANLPLVENSSALRFSYTRNDLPGYIDNSLDGDKDINGGSQTSARAAFLWKGDAVSLDLTAMRQTIDADNNGLVALDPVTEKPMFGDLKNNVYVDEPFSKDVDFYSATIDWDLGWGNFISATGYSDTTTRQRQDSTLIYGEFANLVLGLPSPGSSYFDIDLDLTKFTQEFRLASKNDQPFEWMLGLFYTDEDAKQKQKLYLNQLDGQPLPPDFAPYGTLAVIEIPSNYKETAFFANGSYAFNDLFKLSAGVRYADNDQDFSQNVTQGVLLPLGSTPNSSSEGVFTWSLSPQFQLNDQSMVYARIATGYQPGGPNVVVEGLPSAVDASTLTSYELGLKSQFVDRRLLFELTGFYIDWSDIQVATVVNGISGLVNAGKASSKGMELSTSFRVTDQFELGLNTAYTDAKLDESFPTILISAPPNLVAITNGLKGDALPYVPKWSWALTGDYFFPIGSGWTAHFGGVFRWIGDRKTGTTATQNIYDDTTVPPTLVVGTVTPPYNVDSYGALDLNAYVANENWTLRGYIKNVTDERGYQTISDITSAVTGATGKLVGAPIQPRTIGIEVDYRF
jgi:outer membrane receptor protein involved in Fe transport